MRVFNPETIWLKVHVDEPHPNGPRKASFDLKVKYLPMKERRALFDETAQGGVETDMDVVKRLVVGWRLVEDEEGKEIGFSEDNLEELMCIKHIYLGTMQALYDELLCRETEKKT